MPDISLKIKLENSDMEETTSILKEIIETISKSKDARIESILFTNVQFQLKEKLENA